MTTPDFVTLYQKDGGLQAQPWGGAEAVHFVRRDPAVLAELPEVKALVADALNAAADKIDARGGLEQKDFGLSRATQNFYRARDLVRDFAAAIREGRG